MRKLKLSFADRPRQHFHGIVRAIEGERVNGVGAGNSKMNRDSGRNQNAVRDEEVLLRDHAHGDRAIPVLLSSKIVFDEFSGQVKRQRIDVVGASQKAQQGNIDLVVARGRNEATEPTP